MTLEPTAGRIWKRLAPADRLAAATHLLAEPAPEAVAGAYGAIVRARRMRPQAVRAMSTEAQARALGAILDPGESLAASLLVALHLGERRPLLRAFLDAMNLSHEDGILKEEAEQGPAPTAEAIRAALPALASFPGDHVTVYLNTLYLQDPDRWAALTAVDAA